VIDPAIVVNPLNNYFFTTTSTFMIIAVGWFLTDKVIEPRLRDTPVDGDPAQLPQAMEAMTPAERRGLWSAVLAMLIAAAVFVLTLVPADSPWRAPADAPGGVAGQLAVAQAPAVQAEIGSGRPFLHLSGMYPVERGCMAIVWPLAAHPGNKNELIVWDLAHDPRELASLDADTVRRRLFSKQAELLTAGKGEARLPVKTIHINKSPVVIGNLKTLGAAEKRWPLDVPLAMQHAEAAARLGRTLDSLWPAVFQRPDAGQPVDVDEDLYGGFLSQQDRRSLDRWRALGPAALAHKQPDFEDPRLEELLFRYRARNFAHTLDADDQARWQQHLATRLHQGPAGGLSLAAFFERIDTLAEQGEADAKGRPFVGKVSTPGHSPSASPAR
jgi:hypothetical protein